MWFVSLAVATRGFGTPSSFAVCTGRVTCGPERAASLPNPRSLETGIMTKHLVSLLRKSELVAYKNEIVQRLLLADASLREYAMQQKIEYEQIPDIITAQVVSNCMKGLGFVAEEVKGLGRVTARARGPAGDDPD